MRIERYRNITVFTALLALFLGTETPAHAVETGQVAYYGGTVPGMPRGALGALHTDFPATLVFQMTAQTSPAEVDISYDKIRSVKYSTEVTHHLGVLPAIAVGLIRKRERRHLFAISFTDASGAVQTVLFEVAKDDSQVLLQILRARAAVCQNKAPACSAYGQP